MCLIVMYHYVRNPEYTDYPNIHACSVKDFIGQIDSLSKKYSFITISELISIINDDDTVPNNCCILTFDDGFKDHYTNVFPVLKDKGLTGCFFPITGSIENNEIMMVHKNQFLLNKLGSKLLSQKVNNNLRKYFPKISEEYLVSGEKHLNKYPWDDDLTTNLKYILNTMSKIMLDKIISPCFSNYFDEASFSKELYMNWNEMVEMKNNGMGFGSHSHTHPFLSKITEKEQYDEIIKSKSILESRLKCEISSFCYPYGRFDEFNDYTIIALKKIGFKCGLTAEHGIYKNQNPFKLLRIDTNCVGELF